MDQKGIMVVMSNCVNYSQFSCIGIFLFAFGLHLFLLVFRIVMFIYFMNLKPVRTHTDSLAFSIDVLCTRFDQTYSL